MCLLLHLQIDLMYYFEEKNLCITVTVAEKALSCRALLFAAFFLASPIEQVNGAVNLIFPDNDAQPKRGKDFFWARAGTGHE